MESFFDAFFSFIFYALLLGWPLILFAFIHYYDDMSIDSEVSSSAGVVREYEGNVEAISN